MNKIYLKDLKNIIAQYTNITLHIWNDEKESYDVLYQTISYDFNFDNIPEEMLDMEDMGQGKDSLLIEVGN